VIFCLTAIMQPSTGEPRLAIDYGAADTTAVLVWPDGAWTRLALDGAGVTSNAVYAAVDAEPVVGAAAWRQAVRDPGGFVAMPLRAGTGTVVLPGGELEVAALVAARLRHVAAAAAVVSGGFGEVRMVVPAGWGPRRRTWWRHAAAQAGLGQPQLVEAPVAAAQRLLTVGVTVPVGAVLLMCDLGAGFEATVVRRTP
jgi:molecular chaperone DnaK (HSP70)